MNTKNHIPPLPHLIGKSPTNNIRKTNSYLNYTLNIALITYSEFALKRGIDSTLSSITDDKIKLAFIATYFITAIVILPTSMAGLITAAKYYNYNKKSKKHDAYKPETDIQPTIPLTLALATWGSVITSYTMGTAQFLSNQNQNNNNNQVGVWSNHIISTLTVSCFFCLSAHVYYKFKLKKSLAKSKTLSP